MKSVNSALTTRFAELLGPKGFTSDADLIEPWLHDWRGLYHGKAVAMLSPASVAEVAATVRLAAELRVPLVPQGGNTSMVGGATPPSNGSALILSLRRMNAIRTIDAAAGMAVAEAGVILQNLHDEVGARGMRFPLTLGAKGSATIGGLVSTNAGGTQVLRHGTMRRLTLGLEAVLPDGTIHSGLSALKKDTRGYDLNQLMIGAEGTLGVVTAAALRILPLPADVATGWIGVDSPEVALRLLRFLETRTGDAIESFELVAADSLELVLSHLPDARAPLREPHPWHVLVDLAVKQGSASDALEAALAVAMEAGLVRDAVLAANEAQSFAFWRLRESVSAAEKASGPAMQHDISVPIDAMPRFMVEAAAELERAFPGVTASAFGHLGDGNVHFHARAPKGVDGAEWRASEGKRISAFVYGLVTAAGGSISAEHGIGQMKLGELARIGPASQLAVLRAVKGALDPHHLFNPGKLVPLA
jgi:FAD/FMN-containing dehydrogenase